LKPGVLNVIKPAGATSFAVVKRLRDLTSARRVGHAGTLDPLATGVLPVLFESATRLSDYAHRLPKTYEADVHFGFTTDTDDAEGERRPVADPSGLTEAAVAGALRLFTGLISQEPPAFSAVKVDGERSYRRARKGDLERPAARMVEVYSAELLSFRAGGEAVARVRVVCGSGTYLRSLARDLGAALQVGGYLGKLVRTAYGPLRIEEGVELASLGSGADVEARLLASELVLPEMTPVRLTLEQEAQVRQGRPVRVLPEPGPGPLRAHGAEGRLVALGHTDPLRRTFVPEKVLN
jgi:tRNA pseudouridine55 synthase